MKIAILGYGKMGKEIEKLSQEMGHEVGCIIDSEKDFEAKSADLKSCDVAIEFSVPAAVVSNIEKCFELGLPIVVGTTAWDKEKPRLEMLCKEKNSALLCSSNFSIGVNLYMEIMRLAAKLFKDRSLLNTACALKADSPAASRVLSAASTEACAESSAGVLASDCTQLGTAANSAEGSATAYSIKIEETHHIHKLDAPSGTAKTMSSILKNEIGQDIEIESFREGEIFGIHSTKLESQDDIIEIKHTAKSRRALAFGAIKAAEFLQGKKGWFTMKDILAL